MRGYVEAMERLEYLTGRTPTDAEVLGSMADQMAARMDGAKESRREQHTETEESP